MRKLAWLLIVIAGLLVARPYVTEHLSGRYNPVLNPGPYPPVDGATQALHESLTLVDLHADPLLWDRDLSQRSNRGQVDLPRLQEANMAVQVFGLVTKSPKGKNFDKNSADSDRITMLTVASFWPPKTWTSLLERALYQADKLQQLIAGSDGALVWVRNRQELDQVLAQRAAGKPVIGAMLGLEGAHALEGNPDNVQRLYDAGVRMLGLAHFFDNEMSGSAHGIEQAALSESGLAMVRKAQALGMVIDIAHASPAAVDQVLAMTEVPVLASHSGVFGTCDSPRNLTDERLRKLAATGGVVGIAMFEGAVCGNRIEDTVKAMAHAVEVAGIDHVALGADMDGAVTTPIDVSGMPLLTKAMLEAGFTAEDIHKIMGDNAVRVLRAVLPKEP